MKAPYCLTVAETFVTEALIPSGVTPSVKAVVFTARELYLLQDAVSPAF
jgi:hypothetical protein